MDQFQMVASNKEKLMKGVVFKLNLKGKIEFGHMGAAYHRKAGME